ncbi:MAG: addiction module toxin, HicA family [Acidimicrobiales bacterium]|nr:MAG: addiction module toxin, HicA family [Acidimicrobiales bacterium]
MIRALEKHGGWELARVSGSHHIMKHPVEHRMVPIPMHNRDLKIGTLRGIIRQIGISPDELRRFL